MTAPFTAIVLDLDGTLVDSARELARAINAGLGPLGRRAVEEREIHAMIGDGITMLTRRALAATGDVPEGAAFEAVLADVRRVYDVLPPSPPYPGVPETLALLHDAGVALGVCTNKPEGPARRLLAQLGFDRWIGALAGGDTFPVKKPDPGHVRELLARMGDGSRARRHGRRQRQRRRSGARRGPGLRRGQLWLLPGAGQPGSPPTRWWKASRICRRRSPDYSGRDGLGAGVAPHACGRQVDAGEGDLAAMDAELLARQRRERPVGVLDEGRLPGRALRKPRARCRRAPGWAGSPAAATTPPSRPGRSIRPATRFRAPRHRPGSDARAGTVRARKACISGSRSTRMDDER